jgi:histidine ammonia-lyase
MSTPQPGTELLLRPGSVSLDQLRQICLAAEEDFPEIHLSPDSWTRIGESQASVARMLLQDKKYYGINTGFGLLAQTRIPDNQLDELQHNLVLSHSAGIGELLDPVTVRLMMCLKVISIGRGYSGVRPCVVEQLLHCINHGVTPCIPQQGSVGASGDLAPLAHMAMCLIGEGDAFVKGVRVSAAEALNKTGVAPIQLGPKEGLALLNGTQTSTALALVGLFGAERLFSAALVAGAASVDAIKGSIAPFDPRVHEVRGHWGQIQVAKLLTELLEGSDILNSHIDCDRIQDPYSLRCQPQVMGACLDQLHHAARTLEIEANAATDNPLIFADEVISGGNFHGEPIAFAADMMALAIAEIGALSERRIALMIDPKMSGLPAFLVQNSGLNSGFMMAQVTAAALASENKSIAHPASVDSLPTSANQEDHVSMSTFAARRLNAMNANSAVIAGIELLVALQGIEFHHPCLTSSRLLAVLNKVRSVVSGYENDRYIAPDIESARDLVMGNTFVHYCTSLLPSYTRQGIA